MKKTQKSIKAIMVVVTMGAAFSLASIDAMSQVLGGMATGVSMYNPYSFTSSFGMGGNNSYLLDPSYAMWQTNQQMSQMNAVQNQLINQTNFQTERDMVELNRLNQQFIETSMWQANNGIVLDNVSITTDDRSSYQGKLSPSQYESAYRSYEKSAQSHYNALTSGGIRGQDSNGNISGRTIGQMAGGSYTTAKQGLKNAQEDMKRIRREAEKYGVHIQQSKWETATAGY